MTTEGPPSPSVLPSKGGLWKATRLMLYFVYVGGTTFFCLELLCRFGLLPNPAHRLVTACQSPPHVFRTLILGDSFSVDVEGAYGHLPNSISMARALS